MFGMLRMRMRMGMGRLGEDVEKRVDGWMDGWCWAWARDFPYSRCVGCG